MPVSADRLPLRFRGLGRGKVRGALLVLEGASTGELRRASRICGRLTDSSLLVAVDGGLRTCRRAQRRPDLWVGDGDSTRPPLDLPAVKYPRDKDFSDLAGALREGRRAGARIVVVAGLTGGRLDHEWANLLELGASARFFAGAVAPGERGTVIVTARGCRVGSRAGHTFSLFALGARAVVSLSGARWTLRRRTLRPGSLGLSNEARGAVGLTVHSGTAALVLAPR